MMLSSKEHKNFSIIIPTHNRAKFLKKAVSSVLRQKNVSFEIIIGDNCSTDDTEKVVKSFKDKRIKYFKNSINLGFPGNIRKCFQKAKGRYIFALGDDDLILDEETLFKVFNVMKKYKTGAGSIGAIYFMDSPENPCKMFKLSDKLVLVNPKKDNSLPFKALDFNVSFFSGLILDRSILNINKITDSFNYAYFPLVYDAIAKKGIVYIPNLFVIARISQRFVPQYYDLKKLGSFYIQDYLDLFKKLLDSRDYKRHKKEFLRDSTILLPSIKLFTDNSNYVKVLQRLINIDSSLVINYKFIIFALIGFLPKFVLQALREFMIDKEKTRVGEFVKKYNFYEKLNLLPSDLFN